MTWHLPPLFVIATLFANTSAAQRLPIGFEHADRNSDGVLSRLELIRYLSDRLQMDGAPYGKVFDELDQDHDGRLSEAEFEERHAAIEKVIGPTDSAPDDPGRSYKPYQGPGMPLDDVKTYGAMYARYGELIADNAAWEASGWRTVVLSEIPKSIDLGGKLAVGQATVSSSVDRVSQATAIVVGGGSPDRMLAAGAVLISPDGLALTNYHVAEVFNDKLMALLADGRVARVTKFLAGDRRADIALVQLEGRDFPWAPIATTAPKAADDLYLVHHTENRYYTYDRGYVKRHVVAKDTPWMEIDGDYGPGGSGCGIYNSNHELIGLVSLIMAGDGADIFGEELIPPDSTAETDVTDAAGNSDSEATADSQEVTDSEETEGMEEMGIHEEPLMMGVRVIRVAVPWIAIDRIMRTAK
jgi:hypothetical protein